MKQKLFGFLLAGILSIGLMNCASTKKTTLTDQDIANNIKMSLESPSGPTGPFGIDIWVDKGKVTLDGNVPDQMSKDQAMQIAQNSEGVKELKSFLVTK